ncbi:MAG: 1-acyl-sn-glycerol-3-phosphate acyltransferase [Hydrogenophaga sp.]|uniref:lysophospholipid acyltransferase family protein n=1 Tax=Hydrogenophaga sp. TaxID=1904254 RepID=UPI001DD59DE8|nr:lysophospholipid acyltransferase family protein [Hydrogenophaga sp.]MBW0170820.1 1-acyl-sn-glycerol-3-phosphate acyltransferase [Hydrogenophaga sp.]MBW0182372.1 1-acyl-sn-glycerol-3-phosphate acyltransferase [Hydrogenophaga sp.]
MKPLRALWRGLRATAHVVRGLWIIRTEFGRLTPPQTELVVREWTRRMLLIMGVELVVQGTPPEQGPLLQVANHMSWLDILVMNAARPSRFVSKADAERWPLLGSLITGAGTLYLERGNRRAAMRMVHHMAERLELGDILTVFPEGTTGDGQALLPFHANLLQAAIAARAPVLPIALRFVRSDSGEPHPAPIFVGETTLLGSIWATLNADGLQAVVRYGEPQHDQGRDRRVWANDLRDEIARLLAR